MPSEPNDFDSEKLSAVAARLQAASQNALASAIEADDIAQKFRALAQAIHSPFIPIGTSLIDGEHGLTLCVIDATNELHAVFARGLDITHLLSMEAKKAAMEFLRTH